MEQLYAKQVRSPFPRVSFRSLKEGSCDSFDRGGGQRWPILIAKRRQGACRYAGISHLQ